MKGKLLILFLLFTFKVDCQVYLGNIRDTNASIKEILSYPELIITTDGKLKDTCLKSWDSRLILLRMRKIPFV